jgi:hypothetical protein
MPKVDTSVRELVSMVARGELRLPEMQRPYVWPATRVRDLLDSLYRGYPSGAILVWETDQQAPTRDLAVGQGQNAFATQRLLLDGQQRVTSLCAVIEGKPVRVRNRKRPIEILFNLDHPDGPPVDLTEVEDDSESPVLEFDDDDPTDDEETAEVDIQERLKRRTFVVSSRQLLARPTWIKVSDVFTRNDWTLLKPLGLQPDDARYERYADRLQKLRAIQNYAYVMHVLDRQVSYEEVAEIFVRVNSLGVKLRGSDLALAQVTARWQKSLGLFEQFAEEVDQKSWFTLDVGLLVRAMVVFATGQSRFKTIQAISVDRMQKAWETAKEALRFAVNFLRTNAAIEDESLLSSPLLAVAVAAVGHANDYRLTGANETALLRWALTANARGHFSRGSTETILDQDLAVILRGGTFDDLFDLLKQQFGRLHVEPQDLEGRGARSPLFSTAFLALRAKGAKDWWSGLGLSLVHQGKLHYIEYHHIFPKAVLAAYNYEKAQINEIANFAFISGRVNRSILASEPTKYLPGIIEKRGEEALIAQCIPTERRLWAVENYPEFLAWRRARLAEEINRILGTSARASTASGSV